MLAKLTNLAKNSYHSVIGEISAACNRYYKSKVVHRLPCK